MLRKRHVTHFIFVGLFVTSFSLFWCCLSTSYISTTLEYKYVKPSAQNGEIFINHLVETIERDALPVSNTSLQTYVVHHKSAYDPGLPFVYIADECKSCVNSVIKTKDRVQRDEGEIAELKHLMRKTVSLITTQTYKCKRMIQVGGWSCQKRHDGRKYVCMDILDYLPYGCLAYSFGIGHDFTFENAIASYGCVVFAFDDDDSHNYGSNAFESVFFGRTRLGYSIVVKDMLVTANQKTSRYRYTYRPLDNILSFFGHRNATLHLLKIDIEHDEWDVFERSIFKFGVLRRTQQLLIETHFEIFRKFPIIPRTQLVKQVRSYERVLSQLHKLGFRLVNSELNFISPAFVTIDGESFPLYSEQLWVNTRFESGNRPSIPRNVIKQLQRLHIERKKTS